jgi:hypothetical protein
MKPVTALNPKSSIEDIKNKAENPNFQGLFWLGNKLIINNKKWKKQQTY